MSNYETKEILTVGGVMLAVYGAFIALGAFVFGSMFDYYAEYWIHYFKGEVIDIPFWMSMIAGVLLNAINVIMWIFTLIFQLVAS